MVVGERRDRGPDQAAGRSPQRSTSRPCRHGQTAALLEQERPNIFTQSVGNIEPGQEVQDRDLLRRCAAVRRGRRTSSISRWSSARATSPARRAAAPPPRPPNWKARSRRRCADTDRVPDASRISPPVLKPGYRTGHDISLSVNARCRRADPEPERRPITRPTSTARRRAHGQHQARRRPTRCRTRISCCATASSAKSRRWPCWPTPATIRPTRQQLGNGYFMLMVQPQGRRAADQEPAPRDRVPGRCLGLDVGRADGQGHRGDAGTCSSSAATQDTVQVITFASQAQQAVRKAACRSTRKTSPRPSSFTSRPARRRRHGNAQGRASWPSTSRSTTSGCGSSSCSPTATSATRPRSSSTSARTAATRFASGASASARSPNMFLVDGVAKQGGGMGKQLGLQDERAAADARNHDPHPAGAARQGARSTGAI